MGLELWSKLIFGGLRYFTANDNGKAALHRMVIWQCDNFGVKVRSLPYSSSPPFYNDKFKCIGRPPAELVQTYLFPPECSYP